MAQLEQQLCPSHVRRRPEAGCLGLLCSSRVPPGATLVPAVLHVTSDSAWSSALCL